MNGKTVAYIGFSILFVVLWGSGVFRGCSTESDNERSARNRREERERKGLELRRKTSAIAARFGADCNWISIFERNEDEPLYSYEVQQKVAGSTSNLFVLAEIVDIESRDGQMRLVAYVGDFSHDLYFIVGCTREQAENCIDTVEAADDKVAMVFAPERISGNPFYLYIEEGYNHFTDEIYSSATIGNMIVVEGRCVHLQHIGECPYYEYSELVPVHAQGETPAE